MFITVDIIIMYNAVQKWVSMKRDKIIHHYKGKKAQISNLRNIDINCRNHYWKNV